MSAVQKVHSHRATFPSGELLAAGCCCGIVEIKEIIKILQESNKILKVCLDRTQGLENAHISGCSEVRVRNI